MATWRRIGFRLGGPTDTNHVSGPQQTTPPIRGVSLPYSGPMAGSQTGQARQGLVPARRPADIDYRLARQSTLNAWRAGNLGTEFVCDAQPMLRRNAAECGTPTLETCPVCDDHEVAHVTYVFGPRLPAHGRCISTPGELERLNQRRADLSAYVVEVCAECGWNHLVRITSLGRGQP